MRVKAIETGYNGSIRIKKGQIFEIDEKLFSKRWMKKVDEKEKAEQIKPQKKFGPRSSPGEANFSERRISDDEVL